MNKLIFIFLALLLAPVSTALAEPINLGFMAQPYQQQQPNLTLQPTPTDYCWEGFAYMIPNYEEVCGTANNDNQSEPYRPVAAECIEDGGYSLSKGSYIDNGSIVGSPCDPVGFCSDPSSTDAVVRDHCSDIWSDVDEEGELPAPYVCTGRDHLGHPVICPDLGEGEESEQGEGEIPYLPPPIFEGDGEGDTDEDTGNDGLYGGDQFFDEADDDDNSGGDGGEDNGNEEQADNEDNEGEFN